jgi:hypothetical protein
MIEKTEAIRLNALIWVLFLLVSDGFCAAQPQNNVASGTARGALTGQAKPSGGDAESVIQVTISPSTPHIIKGAVYSIDAQIKNVSSGPVAIDLNTVTLAVQPEVAPTMQGCAWFYDDFYSSSISNKEGEAFVLQPQEHITVFFNIGNSAVRPDPNCILNRLGNIRRNLDFIPGPYTFDLMGRFSAPVSGSALSGSAPTSWSGQRVFSQSAVLDVGIDQANILAFAALGGFFAFLVMAFREQGEAGKVAAAQMWTRSWFKNLAVFAKNAIGAAFLSAAVTIVASRLSSTEFPVKVSVNDFWGALTVGFVSYFVGGKFIDKLAGLIKA